jgi:hypothetical protein
VEVLLADMVRVKAAVAVVQAVLSIDQHFR